MRRLLLASLLAAFLAAVARPGNAQEWTRFRGPNGSGQSEASTIPAQWTENDLNWKFELPGVGHGSPSLWGDKLFVLSADPKSATRYFLCINAATGKQIWRREYPGVPHHLHTRSSFASCTPCVEQDRVYIAWSDPDHTKLLAFDHAGNEAWNQDFGPWVSQHGFGSSPIVYEDLVIVSCSQEPSKQPNTPEPKSSFVVAVDKKNGEIRWRTERGIDTTSYSVPCIRKNEAGQDEIICCSTVEGMFALDPKTGKENWSLPVFDKRTASSPQLVAGLIFGTTGSGGGGNYLTAIRPGETPKVEYEVRRQAPYVPTPVARGDLLFLFEDKSGFVSCIEAATGEEVWQERLNVPFSGSPVRAGDKLFCVAEDGTVVCVAAEREFKELGRTPLNEECRSTPAIAGGRLYIRTISHLFSVGGK
jgi:outer membrane protein assembly factor BamB